MSTLQAQSTDEEIPDDEGGGNGCKMGKNHTSSNGNLVVYINAINYRTKRDYENKCDNLLTHRIFKRTKK